MISVNKFTLLVFGLALGLSAHLALGQFTNDDFVNQDDGDQLGDVGQQLNRYGPSMGPEYYGSPAQHQLEEEQDDDPIGSLADELLAARRRQRPMESQVELELEQAQDNLPEGVSALLDQLSNQKRQNRPNSGYYYYDINSHLPASSLSGSDEGSISKPVNDPEEFEAQLGQLTDALNHNMANTKDRQELLLGLLNRSDEFDSDKGLQRPINSLSSISQLEMDRLVGELSKMLEDQASDQQQQQDQEHQQQMNDNDPDGFDLATTMSRYGGSEYIDHPLALAGHQYVQGGAGEGRQLLGPDGTYENVQVIKTDSAIPSYCDPPNPCPIGFTAKDGCLEEFVNSASFSREYQAQQKCSCDNEHSLFNCASPMSSGSQESSKQDSTTTSNASEDNSSSSSSSSSSPFELGSKLDTLARTIQNRFGDLASVQRLIGKQQKDEESNNNINYGQDPLLSGNDESNPNYLVRSARKLSSLDMHHKVDLD